MSHSFSAWAGGLPQVTQAIAAWPFSLEPSEYLGVAFSGGADSTAALWACAHRWPNRVVALHVNHGLQAAAADFERHCEDGCRRWDISLRVARVHAQAQPGQSPEDAARQARYAALASLCRGGGELQFSEGGLPTIRHVVLGQHADDQVETLLLALSRGAGLPGLAAMSPRFERMGVVYHRPLLGLESQTIRSELRAAGLPWVEDPTNTDTRYTRNRIRSVLMPALQATFPGFRQTFSRSARHAAQADALMREWAELDGQRVGNPPRIKALQELSEARQAHVLRHWLVSVHGDQARASTAQLHELLQQIKDCTTRGHRLRIKVGRGHVERQGDVLQWVSVA